MLKELCKIAFSKNATDIHIDIEYEKCFISMRIDGIINIYKYISKDDHSVIINQVKIIAKLRNDISFLPQDGVFNEKDFDIRVSILPTPHGEALVMRILYRNIAKKLKISDLFLTHKMEKDLLDVLKNKSGLILITGSTGSGKTTTLYSILNEIKNNGKIIITVEDPVEYSIGGIRQVQVNNQTGMTVSDFVKYAMRQNPDVLVIGEVRNKESALIMIESALTGHLCIATMHGGNVDKAIQRLYSFGISKEELSQSLLMLSYQQLIYKKNKRVPVFEYIINSKEYSYQNKQSILNDTQEKYERKII